MRCARVNHCLNRETCDNTRNRSHRAYVRRRGGLLHAARYLRRRPDALVERFECVPEKRIECDETLQLASVAAYRLFCVFDVHTCVRDDCDDRLLELKTLLHSSAVFRAPCGHIAMQVLQSTHRLRLIEIVLSSLYSNTSTGQTDTHAPHCTHSASSNTIGVSISRTSAPRRRKAAATSSTRSSGTSITISPIEASTNARSILRRTPVSSTTSASSGSCIIFCENFNTIFTDAS